MILWLLAAVVLGAAAVGLGWPAYRARRAREAGDLNAERYRSWRGRATPSRPLGKSALDDIAELRQRQRLIAAAVLGAAAFFCLVAFFSTGG